MKNKMSALALALLVAAGACSRSGNRAADSSLNTDLSLAAQQSHSLDSLSAAERTPAANALNGTTTPAGTVTPLERRWTRVLERRKRFDEQRSRGEAHPA
jgi:hypothetical protein